MYKITIADVAELTEEVIKVEFASTIPQNADARSSAIGATLTIVGRVAYDADKPFMKDSTKAIAGWSMVKPDSADTYKTVSVVFDHTGLTRSYELSHAFVVSFHEQFEDQNGFFELVVRQKKDRLDGVKVE
ncbi:MAG: membrane-associated protease 1 [Clostridiales bacterium]|nr:membrane-associated protease 1 [Clostridiales bacterium]